MLNAVLERIDQLADLATWEHFANMDFGFRGKSANAERRVAAADNAGAM
jgi:hypothetical protein